MSFPKLIPPFTLTELGAPKENCFYYYNPGKCNSIGRHVKKTQECEMNFLIKCIEKHMEIHKNIT